MQLVQMVMRLGILVCLILGLSAAPAQASHAPSHPAINVQPPFSGYWDKYGLSGPAIHRPVTGADWAVDMYRSPGSTVRVRAFPVSGSGSVAYRIAAVTRACASGVYANGGNAVKVEFHYGGYLVGHAWYLHLANVPVQAGQWVGHGALLGYTARFTQNACYDVPNDAGVHVHFELYSSRHHACYIRRSAGTWVDYWKVIGKIGGNYASTTMTACP